MMQKILGLLLSRMAVGVAGVALFAALVWYGGRAIPLSVPTRLWILGIGLVLFAGFFVLQRILVARNSKAMEDRLRDQGVEQKQAALPSEQEEIEALEGQFNEALAALRQSKMGRGALYAFPWYVIIGPPGSGKSTLINECKSLNMPYTKHGRGEVRGVGGTRNCDWFFTDQAILLDTAGRYMTEMEDREEWLAFLQMLGQGRKHQPINGVLVAISIPEIVAATEDELNKHAENIRNRLDELTKTLDVVCPVYLIFTKFDLLDGFVEFFGSYEREERSQVWGCTVDPDPKNERRFADAFDAGFRELYSRLDSERVVQLSVDRSRRRKQKTYSFPLQLALARRRLGQLVEAIAQPNPYQESAFFRGFYFSSGTQEGEPIDHVINTVGAALGVSIPSMAESASVQPQAYFIDDLFTKVIFPDQHVGRRTAKIEKRRRWFRHLVTRGSAALAVLLLAGFTISFFANLSVVKQAKERVDSFEKALQSDKPAKLAAELDLLSGQILALQPDARGFFSGWGLDFGKKLQERSIDYYRPALKEHFLVPTVRKLKQTIERTIVDWKKDLRQDRRPSQSDQDLLQRQYHVYQGLTDPRLPAPGTADLAVVLGRSATAGVWTASAGFPNGTVQRDFFVESVVGKELFAGWQCSSPDLSEQMDGILNLVNADVQLYNESCEDPLIKGRTTRLSQIIDASMAREFVGPTPAEPEIPSVFVLNSDEDIRFREKLKMEVARAAKATGGDVTAKQKAVLAVHHKRAADAWLKFIGDIRPRAFGTMSVAKQRLSTFLGGASPYVELHKRILEKWPGLQSDAESSKGMVEALKSVTKLLEALGQISDTQVRFDSFKPDTYEAFKLQFERSRSELELSSLPPRHRHIVKTLLLKVWEECDRTIKVGFAKSINDAWAKTLFQKAVSNHNAYPFKKSRDEVTSSGMEIYRANGELDAFFGKVDSAFKTLLSEHRPMKEQGDHGFASYQKWVGELRSALFNGGDTVKVEGTLEFEQPTNESPITDFEIRFDGDSWALQLNTEPKWHFSWKLGQSGNTGFKVQLGSAGFAKDRKWVPYAEKSVPPGLGESLAGNWGFIRLLQAGIEAGEKSGGDAKGRCLWTFDTGKGQSVTVRARIAFKGANPFEGDLLTRWTEPPKRVCIEQVAGGGPK